MYFLDFHYFFFSDNVFYEHVRVKAGENKGSVRILERMLWIIFIPARVTPPTRDHVGPVSPSPMAVVEAVLRVIKLITTPAVRTPLSFFQVDSLASGVFVPAIKTIRTSMHMAIASRIVTIKHVRANVTAGYRPWLWLW